MTDVATAAAAEWELRMRGTGHAFAAAAAVIAVVAMVGWATDIEILSAVVPGLPTMKASTAAAVLLLGAGVALGPASRRMAALLSAAGGLTGAAFVVEHLFDVDFGLSRIPGAVSFVLGPQGPPSMVTSIALAALGTAGVLGATARDRVLLAIADVATVFAGLVGAFAATTYVYDLHSLEPIEAFRSMAIPTAIAIMALSVATLARRGRHGPLGFLAGDGPGARIARMLLPAVVVVPVVTDSLVLIAIKSYGLDEPTALALSTVAYLSVLSALLIFAARHIERLDTARRMAERAVRQANQELESRVDERTRDLELAKRVSEEASAAKSLFLASMSHEIRTPLTATIGFAQ
ncbi:MAG: histidine kinase dimerization/phospho-acceptor domain-containing protein, partial [Alphaproteobacteria bacterium]